MNKKYIILFAVVILLLVLTISLKTIKTEQQLITNGIDYDNVTFLATIEKIDEYNGKTTLLVKGLEENNINFKGNFTFAIKETTEIFLNNDIAEKEDLKMGQTILIEFTGEVLESSPAQIDVTKIVIQ